MQAALRRYRRQSDQGVEPARNRLASGDRRQDCQLVINLIGILNERGRDGSGFVRAHVTAVEALLAGCRQAGVKKFIQVSSLQASAEGPSHYLRSRGQAENLVRQSQDLAWTIIQPSVIFGPGDSFLNRFASLLRLTPWVFPLACPDARFAPVHVDDVVAVLIRAATDPETDGRCFELGGPQEYRLEELVRSVAEELGLSRRILRLKYPLAWIQASVLEFFPGKPLSRDNLRSLSVDSVPVQNGFKALGIDPRSLAAHLGASLGINRSSAALDAMRRTAGR